MKKLIIRVLVLIIVCSLLICPFNYLLTNYNGHYTYKMLEEMYNCKENIEVLFLGSSHTYRSYDPVIATDILGKRTFNAGSSSQLLDHSYYMLKEVAKTNNIHTVYLDTYFSVASADTSKDQWSVYILTDYMKNSINKFDFLYASGGLTTVFNGYISARRNIENTNIPDNLSSRNIVLEDYSTVTFENEEYRGDGFVYSYETLDIVNMPLKINSESELNKTPISKFSYYYLMKIIEFCEEKNIELVLVDQPMPREFLNSINGYDSYVHYMYKLANEYNIKYLNFNCYQEPTGLSIYDYKDWDHLNGHGAEIYTTLFCNTIQKLESNEDLATELFSDSYKGE